VKLVLEWLRRERESSSFQEFWMPTFAGMTISRCSVNLEISSNDTNTVSRNPCLHAFIGRCDSNNLSAPREVYVAHGPDIFPDPDFFLAFVAERNIILPFFQRADLPAGPSRWASVSSVLKHLSTAAACFYRSLSARAARISGKKGGERNEENYCNYSCCGDCRGFSRCRLPAERGPEAGA
jgi:hypothetical protein